MICAKNAAADLAVARCGLAGMRMATTTIITTRLTIITTTSMLMATPMRHSSWT